MLKRDGEVGFGRPASARVPRTSASASSAIAARGTDAGDLARVLDGPEGLHHPLGGDQLHVGHGGGERPLLGPGDTVGLEAEPAVWLERVDEDGLLGGSGQADLDAGVDPAAVSCSWAWVW